MSNLIIVAIPDENDRVWKVSSEKVPHLTLLFLSETGQTANLDKIVSFVEHATSMMNRFYLTVDRRGELGEDQADVLFFKKERYSYKAVRDFRASLLQDNNIRTAYDSVPQFEGPWNPHLTLGYPTAPAKPEDNDWGRFYSVDFNRIAVWTGDYEGPEFLLKDFWDEYEMMETVPMDVAMSDIQHFGTKGMRWGVRNERSSGSSDSSTTKIRKGLKNFAKDVYFETSWSSESAEHKVTVEASKKWREQDVPRLNAQYTGTKAATLKSRLKNPAAKETIEYRSRSRAAFRDRLNEEVANLPGNASGTRRYAIEDNGASNANYIWHLKPVDVKRRSGLDHAATNEEVDLPNLPEFRVRVIFDDDGLIVGFEQVPLEDSMAQTEVLGASFLAHVGIIEDGDILEHYGVKGQKWGVRKNPRTGLTEGETKREGVHRYLDPQGHRLDDDVAKSLIGVLVPVIAPVTWPASIRITRGAVRGAQKKVLDIQEKRFAKNAMSPKNFVAIHNGAIDKANRDLVTINAKYPKPNVNAKTQKKYDDEVLASLQNAYRESANSIGNKAGTHHLEIEFKNDGVDFVIHAREGAPTPQPKRVKHATEDVVDEEITVEITGKIKRDAAGHIIGFDLDHLDTDSAQHTVDLGATLISTLFNGGAVEHYGVKGMRWGVRRQGALTTKTHIDTGLIRRRTQVVAKGGEAHPAHDDAVKAAVTRQKLKKSGTDALSNQELRELANRVQLENQVTLLTSSKGKRFVQKELEEQGKQEFKKGAARAAPHVIRKVRRGAAVGAAAAALA